MQTGPVPMRQGWLPLTHCPTQKSICFNGSALCSPPRFLSQVPLGPKDMGASGNGTQKCCPVLNAVVPVPPSKVWHLRTHEIPPLQKKKKTNCDRRKCSHTTFLIGPLDKANIAEEQRMGRKERSARKDKEEE